MKYKSNINEDVNQINEGVTKIYFKYDSNINEDIIQI